MIVAVVFLTIVYLLIGLLFMTAYMDKRPKASESKICALFVFWPIICILYFFKFFKLSFKGLKEWFE